MTATAPPVSTTIEAEGVREAMRTLGKLEPALKRQAVKDIKLAAEPLRGAVASALPATAPLSGMDHRGRTGWQASGARTVSTKYGGRYSRSARSWPLVSVLIKGVAGSIFDMAGRGSGGSTPSGAAMVGALNAIGGLASRAAWPAAEARQGSIESALRQACDKTAEVLNSELEKRGAV